MNETSFPQRLAEERKARGYTQKQVAEALGISDRTYSKWETGENEMDVASLCRLAEVYGASPAVFFPTDGLKPEGVRSSLGVLPPGEAAECAFRFHYEALMGMNDSIMAEQRRDSSFIRSPLPFAAIPENPTEQRAQAPNSITTFAFPNLSAIFAAGEDMNLSLLLEPAEQGFSWLVKEPKELGTIFRVLGMPGPSPASISCCGSPTRTCFPSPTWRSRPGRRRRRSPPFWLRRCP